MFCLLMRCVLLPLRAFRPWVLNQPGRILTAYAIYTPSDGSSRTGGDKGEWKGSYGTKEEALAALETEVNAS